MIKDYVSIPENGLRHVLQGKRIALAGDVFLCHRLKRYMSDQIQGVEIRYINTDGLENNIFYDMEEIETDQIQDGDTVFLVYPELYGGGTQQQNLFKENKQAKIQYLEANGIVDFCEYFSKYSSSFVQDIYDNRSLSVKENIRVKGIMLGMTAWHSGNYFLRDCLDSHPNILMISERSGFGAYLYWICIRLAELEAGCIVDSFWKLYTQECVDGENVLKGKEDAFSQELAGLLGSASNFTSQELFIIFHIAYSRLWGKKINVRDMIIYWEPHDIWRSIGYGFSKWLDLESVNGYIICLTRNICTKSGSNLKGHFPMSKSNVGDLVLFDTDGYKILEKMPKNNKWENIIFKFEELKTRPRETMQKLCERLNIVWSDSLLQTTCHGEEASYVAKKEVITGFDLMPVYNLYEEYFSELDRMRLMILNASRQKKYNYPYVMQSEFSRYELQEMFLKDYRFEHIFQFVSAKEKKLWKIKLKNMVDERLWQERRKELF